MDLNGKVALVTGAGRGLGEAISLTLAESGVTVVAADLRQAEAKTVARKVQEIGSPSLAIQMDVSDEKAVSDSIGAVVSEFGALDILINNAGADFTLPIDELSAEQWDRVINTNLRGPFLLSKYAFTKMKENGGGIIVNIASTAAKRAWANASAYHASKWGLLGLSHALHVEGRPHRVKVTALVCGGMRTPFLLERFPDIDVNVLQDPKNVAQCVKFVLTQPDETVIPELLVIPMRETSWP